MLIALDEKGVRFDIKDAIELKKVSPSVQFYCPVCNEQVMIKNGQVKIPHFAHYPNSSCTYGQGETEEHMRMKRVIYDKIPLKFRRKLEYKIEDGDNYCIADCFFKKRAVYAKPVAIECIYKNTNYAHFLAKQEFYAKKKIKVMWIFPYKINGKEKYNFTSYFDDINRLISNSLTNMVIEVEDKIPSSLPSSAFHSPIDRYKILSKLSKEIETAKNYCYEEIFDGIDTLGNNYCTTVNSIMKDLNEDIYVLDYDRGDIYRVIFQPYYNDKGKKLKQKRKVFYQPISFDGSLDICSYDAFIKNYIETFV